MKNSIDFVQVLDVEHSAQVTDIGDEDICKCVFLVQLNIFHTGLTTFGQAKILGRLKRLKRLIRGDFLCEALALLKAERLENDLPVPVLLLEEFWASEDYFFHDADQMALVAEMCPRIAKMMFQFDEQSAGSFLVLATFEHLVELHSWGGDYYRNGLDQLLLQIGTRLSILYLIHVDELDQQALHEISQRCPNLETLGFYNCILGETRLERGQEPMR